MIPPMSVTELLAALADYHETTGQLSFYSDQCGNETVITFFVVDSSVLERQAAVRT